jgi:hypothetical protein
MNMLAPLDRSGLESPGFLLCHTDEEHSIRLSETGMIALIDIVLPLSLSKLNHRDAHFSGKAFYLVMQTLGDVTEQLG